MREIDCSRATVLAITGALLIGSLASNVGAATQSTVWFGNSLTDEGSIYVGVPNMINCDTCGIQEDMTIDSVLTFMVGGCDLTCHESVSNAFSVIDNGHYDLVFAQPGMNNACYDLGDVLNCQKTLSDQITNWATHTKTAGGSLVLEQIWLHIGTGTAQEIDLSDYWNDSISRVTNAIFVPAGRAMWAAYQLRPNLEYADPVWNDGGHEGMFGRYLICCTFYAALTGKSPVGLKYHCDGWGYKDLLSDADALFAQQQAWEAIQYFNPQSNMTVTNFSANPRIIVQGSQNVTFSATVTNDKPMANIMLDLSAIGGPGNVAMAANGSTYTYTHALPANVSLGKKIIAVRATDNARSFKVSRIPLKIERPLAVASVKALHNNSRVRVHFSEILDKTTATTLGNYSIDHGVAISQATFDDDSQTVWLSTGTLSTGVSYTLTANNVRDDAGSIIPSATTTGFVFDPLSSGITYDYYEPASISSFGDLAGLQPKIHGVVSNISITPAQRASNYALDFQGLISVPKLGQYWFYTTADDQDEVYIDDVLVVTTNYGSAEKSNKLILSADFHKIRVRQMQSGGGQGLAISWSGPSISKAAIPDSVLFYDQSGTVNISKSPAPRAGSRSLQCLLRNGSVLVRSVAPGATHVTIYSTSGKLVISGLLIKGTTMTLTPRDLSSGMYLVKMENSGAVETQRVQVGY